MVIKNLIFDWSGVISDDLYAVYKATMSIFKRLGTNEVSFEKFRDDFCIPYMDYYRENTNTSDKMLINQIFLETYGTEYEAKIYDNAKDVLRKLNSNGINMIIMSSQLRPFIEKEINAFGLVGTFSEIHANVHNKVEEIENIMKEAGLSQKETAYIGDMSHDIKAAKKAGITMIASSYGYVQREKLEKHNPDYIIDDINELPKILSISN